jgi:hypothetical protein
MNDRNFVIDSFIYTGFGLAIGGYLLGITRISDIVLSHNLIYFIGFWCTFFTVWSIAFIWVKWKNLCKKLPEHREKKIGFSYLLLLLFLGVLIVADFYLLSLLIA